MKRIIMLSRLREDVDPVDYERWVTEVDYPFARTLTAIRSYELSRMEGHLFGTDGKFGRTYDYAEVIDVSAMDAYMASINTTEGQAFLKEWSQYVEDFVAVSTTIIPPN